MSVFVVVNPTKPQLETIIIWNPALIIFGFAALKLIAVNVVNLPLSLSLLNFTVPLPSAY